MAYSIDLEEIAAKLEFDQKDVEMLIEVFLTGADDSLKTLEKAIDDNDLEKVFQAAHTIKGSAANLTLDKISDLAEEIESSAYRGEISDYKGKYGSLKELISKIRA